MKRDAGAGTGTESLDHVGPAVAVGVAQRENAVKQGFGVNIPVGGDGQ